ncbi:MAG TPA: membrane protein insertion efficiency factor YidD [Candidatus Woesebacteria bacterium]|nr:membrane protein insertion efficiency factor YidD [Candidatus Woesebacteria bacterium]HRS23045.1 membrane protein insertion efficiency factor YidD [Candidatus Woesebacteria bacterium]HRT40069.1 membrane protein insertion efficiency factor YidD [Candidatus Woesebacteria bacterium]
MKKVILGILNFYSRIPYWGHAGCRFIPSCSEYTKEAVEKYGAVGGLILGLKRISKCHPFKKGGIDLVK